MPSLQSVHPMEVLENDCPFHRGEFTKLVRIDGTRAELRDAGYLDDESDGPIGLAPAIRKDDPVKFQIYEDDSETILHYEWLCPHGCRLEAYKSRFSDWTAQGTPAG